MNDRTHDPGNTGNQSQQQDNNGPADVLRDGNIKATIWKNERESGPSFSTTFARTWQDDQGAYRDSQSFSGTELLRVSELARGAYARTNELRQEHAQELRVEITRDDREQDASQDDRESFRAKRNAPDTQGRSQNVRRK